MGEVRWDFPICGTASTSGSNDAGITTFQDDKLDNLIREVCQNSLDARNRAVPADEPVRVKFRLFEIERDRFEVFRGLERTLAGAHEFWHDNTSLTPDTSNLLDMLSRYLGMKKIPVLLISDYNTTGLTGVKPARGKISHWDQLVNTEGVSIKQDANSAGSFGIGKNAPFVYSGLRTVFYSTLAIDGGRAFEGVARWVSTLREYHDKKKKTFPVGKYLYLEDELTGSPIFPEHECDIANIDEFRRLEPGTDIAIAGFKTNEYKEWEKQAVVAVLSNFILSIFTGRLEVEIQTPFRRYLVSKNELEKLLDETPRDDKKLILARQIYMTLTNSKPRFFSIAEKNDLSIYVRYDENFTLRCCARFRAGMLINAKGTTPRHYTAVIIANDVGKMMLTTTLKATESPRHNEWERKNVRDKQLRKRATEYLKAIGKALVKVLDEYDNADITDCMDAGVGNYLPDVSVETPGRGTDALRKDVKVTEILRDGKVISSQYDSAALKEGLETQNSILKTGTQKTRKKLKGKTAVVNPDEAVITGFAPGAGQTKLPSAIFSEYRVYRIEGNRYHMYINSPKKYDKVNIWFCAAGEDDKQTVLRIKNVSAEGMPLKNFYREKSVPIQIREGDNNLSIEFENSEMLAVVPHFVNGEVII